MGAMAFVADFVGAVFITGISVLVAGGGSAFITVFWGISVLVALVVVTVAVVAALRGF